MISARRGWGQILEGLTFGCDGSSLASMLDLERALETARKAAHLGREVLLDYFGQLSGVSEKKQAGLVSEADVESERVITRYLREEFPHMAILGEEDSYKKQGQGLGHSELFSEKDRQNGLWLIDPLDGTTNYVHKFPIYCVSIGLEYKGELVVAVCDVPIFKKTYTATRGGGAFVEVDGQREKIRVSGRKSVSEALLATGFSSNDKSDRQIRIFEKLIYEARGVRRAGSAAYDLCMVAEGIFDAYWESGLSPWDTAAGALLVMEAGGVVTNYESDQFSPFDKTVIAGSPALHFYVKQKIQSV